MPIYIKENQDKSYFYLCGIRPIREVRLGDGITLMPATSTPTPDDMIDSIMKSNHASEMELGILIATLRMTTAQIKIEGAIGKELAMKTWNAQQICVLISAILNCDLAWYFQADRPGEMFSANTDIHIIMENVYKIPNECIEVSYEKCSFLETRIEKACKLAEVNEKFYLATNAMWSYRLNFMPAIRISVIWSGIEALFMVDRNIKNTIAIMSSRFIYGNDDMIEDIKTLYKSARCKAMGKIDEAEKYVPKELMQERPLSDYVYAIRIEKREVGLNEVYGYSVRNETYWLLNNYFVSSKNEKKIIDFCRGHEEIFEKDWQLFFMYQGALKVLGLNDEREFQLKKHTDELSNVYEYWNELLNLSDLEENQNAFVEACRDGKMTSLFNHSDYLIIERLLNFHEYDIAELYVTKHEKAGEKSFRIKKYKAIILQGKKNDVEALKWYRLAFEDNGTDECFVCNHGNNAVRLLLIQNMYGENDPEWLC